MKQLLIAGLSLFLFSCSSDIQEQEKVMEESEPEFQNLRWVGDSKYDPKIDTLEFELCNKEFQAKQYFNVGDGMVYKGEKKALRNTITAKYQSVVSDQSGMIRIRFIVNCNGETGRFRIMSSDENYNEMKFDPKITNQLLQITRSLDGWGIKSDGYKNIDYYQYLIFKINNGRLIEILP